MSRNSVYYGLLLGILLLLSQNTVGAQMNKMPIEVRVQTIEKLSQMLGELYVNPEIGKKMVKQLKANLKNGKYDKIENFHQFAMVIKQDLFDISKDNHLNIYYNPQQVGYLKKLKDASMQEKNDFALKEKMNESKNNFGFEAVKILPGNIGYIQLTTFANSQYAGDTAAAAMNFISNTDSVIIDLRYNNGGWPSMAQLLASYFFEYNESGNTVLFEQHITYSKEIIAYATLPIVVGKRMPNVPLYILVNKSSISAAEGFAYCLQKLGRATVIGEQTNFGGHSTRGPEILNDYFVVQMPVGNIISPITQKGWEGTGVTPDILTESRDAVNTAVKIVLAKQIVKNPDENSVNDLGYSLLVRGSMELAIFVFGENVKNHPQSANVYDSLGEVYMQTGNKDLAIQNYERSLQLNPKNTGAEENLKKLKDMK